MSHHLTAARVGARIRERRRDRGMSLRDLDALSGIGYQHISKYENGHKMPTIATLDALVAPMGWTLSQFFKGLT